jgi:hypothetical protein
LNIFLSDVFCITPHPDLEGKVIVIVKSSSTDVIEMTNRSCTNSKQGIAASLSETEISKCVTAVGNTAPPLAAAAAVAGLTV